MNKEVFVIDDDEDVRDIIEFALRNEGFKVRCFESAARALEVLRTTTIENYPGLLLVDYRMPEMDGLTFIRSFKKIALKNVPIALSSANEDMDKMEALPGDLIILNKPMELEDLLKTVKGVLS